MAAHPRRSDLVGVEATCQKERPGRLPSVGPFSFFRAMLYFAPALVGPMGLMRLRPAVAQLATQNLADIALGQFSPEFDDLRPLVAGQLLFAIREDVRI